MTDIEMLPLPEWTKRDDAGQNMVPSEIRVSMADYARAVAEHNVKERDAEIEALRAERDLFRDETITLVRQNGEWQAHAERLQAELDNRWAQGVHTCHDKCQRVACVLRRDNKRLAEALQIAEAALADIGDADREPGDDVSWCERRAALGLRRVRDTLRDHDQEPTHD